ncbi:MAG TPA: FAD-linked oxidase C-terminal domain-containing protein [Bacteroidales bacterium]|nr:FAD-linked oxidase C-terminal domain-containing protein [Bacteroidales bacterium]
METAKSVSNNISDKLLKLDSYLEGDVYVNEIWRKLYATDASAYREMPLGVVRPKNTKDLKKLIAFANKNKTSLIPRTAGTSLAGQVVGSGIVTDVSKYMTSILEINEEEKWIRVEPGVVLEEMNQILLKKGLFFGPETSTANRCMMGGMVGNNSCGLHSLVYGSTRDHTISVTALLSDGSEATFGPLTNEKFKEKCQLDNKEGEIYRKMDEIFSNQENQDEIRAHFPDPEIHRRNTGYALDLLLDSNVFGKSEEPFNLSKLINGSEGTLAFITEIKLNLVETPPKHKALLCVHFNKLSDAFKGNLVALKHHPTAVELMDKKILDLTKGNIEQRKNRFFVEGDPEAILIIEFARQSEAELEKVVNASLSDFKNQKMGYSFPVVKGKDIPKVWNLRKAGLGVLSNLPGDAKPVSVIEDTSVKPELLPEYMEEFGQLMERYKLECVYHAHIATGELHLRPILNLKDPGDVELFRTVARETAELVKKYRGSLSGEHGDGRLRGEFIPLMVGDKNYKLMKEVKEVFDPNHIFNPGKIVDTPPMNSSLRYEPGLPTREIETVFDFSKEQGILRAAEKCNGSGDCRKSEKIGGTMCPSYQATRDETATTRARANILREFLTNSNKENPFNHEEIYEVLDLCLSCKGCKSECPSNVDVAKLKAEFLQHYYDDNGIPLRTRAIAYISHINKLGAFLPGITNFFMSNPLTSSLMKRALGFAPDRSIPLLYKTTLRTWAKKNLPRLNPKNPIKRVNLFTDEFTQFNDTEIGIKTIKLLTKLGYEVSLPHHEISGRTFLSKGLLRKAKAIANHNIELLSPHVTPEAPLIGIEPSGILTFRDEYPDLANPENMVKAKKLAASALMFDEFFEKEVAAGNITPEQFTGEKVNIKLHGHCQQKAVASTTPTIKMLSFPKGYHVEEIPSGCCGMAGSFGYEKEHYEVSMKVGELVLLPEVRQTPSETILAAPGTSCRHQIKDGADRKASHPAEILWEAVIK